MIDLLSALLIVVLLCCSAGLGMFISPRLPPAHRARETIEMMTLTIGMLVTFAALVLGLITASVKSAYDDAMHYRQEYALQLTQLDRCLRNYGAGADAARAYIRSYTAAAIASIWPSEPPPVGVHYPDTSGMHNLIITGEVPAITDLMNHAGLEISRFSPTDATQVRIAENCRQDYRDVVRALDRARDKECTTLGALLPDLGVLADDHFRELRPCGPTPQPLGDFHRSLRCFA